MLNFIEGGWKLFIVRKVYWLKNGLGTHEIGLYPVVYVLSFEFIQGFLNRNFEDEIDEGFAVRKVVTVSNGFEDFRVAEYGMLSMYR